MSRKVLGSSPDEVIECFDFTRFFQPHHCPGVYSASNKKWIPEDICGGIERPARKTDNLTAVYEPIV
jgi:hypothetical protein